MNTNIPAPTTQQFYATNSPHGMPLSGRGAYSIDLQGSAPIPYYCNLSKRDLPSSLHVQYVVLSTHQGTWSLMCFLYYVVLYVYTVHKTA
jgi:hypothetical protein